MSTIVRTWPYGTEKKVKVEYASNALIICVEGNEAFLLVRHADIEIPCAGAEVVIVFMEGGPTGGYWKIKRQDSK